MSKPTHLRVPMPEEAEAGVHRPKVVSTRQDTSQQGACKGVGDAADI